MSYLIWIGVAMSVTGLVAILWTITAVARARRAQLTDEELKARMQAIMPINIGALMLSILGLGIVVVALLLG